MGPACLCLRVFHESSPPCRGLTRSSVVQPHPGLEWGACRQQPRPHPQTQVPLGLGAGLRGTSTLSTAVSQHLASLPLNLPVSPWARDHQPISWMTTQAQRGPTLLTVAQPTGDLGDDLGHRPLHSAGGCRDASSWVTPFSCLQSCPASGSFPVSCLFPSGSQVLELQLQHQSFQ